MSLSTVLQLLVPTSNGVLVLRCGFPAYGREAPLRAVVSVGMNERKKSRVFLRELGAFYWLHGIVPPPLSPFLEWLHHLEGQVGWWLMAVLAGQLRNGVVMAVVAAWCGIRICLQDLEMTILDGA
ncbi:hypothetical protein R6Q59_010414 [Mikania micrantha]